MHKVFLSLLFVVTMWSASSQVVTIKECMRLATMDSTAMDAFFFIKNMKLAEATHHTSGYKCTYIQGGDSIRIVSKEVKAMGEKSYARITFITTNNTELLAVMNQLKILRATRMKDIEQSGPHGFTERIYKFQQWNIQLYTYNTTKGSATFVTVNCRVK